MRFFSKGDLNAFWALFADNLANLILITGICSVIFKMPSQVVFGHILPGLGVALVIGLSVYAYLAYRLGQKQKRTDVTALPYGISSPIMFIYLFGIIGPVYWKTKDPVLAWQVGLAAACLGGIVEITGAVFGPWLKRNLPRAGMLGTLAGIAITFIAIVPLAEIFEHPLVGLPSLAIIIIGLVALVRLPGGLPAGLVAICLGVIIGLITGDAKLSVEGMGVYPPIPVFSDLVQGIAALFTYPWIFAIVIPAEIYNFIETMNNVESADAAGDTYPVGTCQVLDGVGTLVGVIFGSPFPTTVYIGHPGYKRMGGGSGYALGVGVVLFLASIFGGLALLHNLVPIAAVAPMLVFVGLVITAQAFHASPKAHGLAVTFAMLPHLSDLLVTKLGSLRSAIGDVLGNQLPELSSPEIVSAMLDQGAHIVGHTTLAGGSIVVGLCWGSVTAFIIDKAWYKAALVMALCWLMSMFGVIHASYMGIFFGQLVWAYFALAVALVVIGWLRRYFRSI